MPSASASSPRGERQTTKKSNTTARIPDTPEEIERAALSDPDAQPLTEADFRWMKRTPQAKIIRRALSLTQEEFALRYQIPAGTLRDWEQGRSEPDQPTRAYLKLIASRISNPARFFLSVFICVHLVRQAKSG